MAWAIHGGVSVLIAKETCDAGGDGLTRPILLTVFIIALAICLSAAIVAYGSLRRLSERSRLLRSEAHGRRELIALGGVIHGVVFAIAVIWNGLPLLLLRDVCEAMR